MSIVRKIYLKTLVYFSKGVYLSFRKLSRGAGFVFRPIKKGFRLIGKSIIFPIYKTQLFIKRKIFNFYSPAKSRLFLLLTKKYIIHVFVVLLSVFVVTGNLNAQEMRAENYGEETIVYSLFTDSPEYELVEENAVFQPQEKILSYLDKSAQVENIKVVSDAATITQEQWAEGFGTTTQGGGVLIKPNIADTGIIATTRIKVVNHTVEDGETISTIAEKYGISTNSILWANNLSAKSLIKPGMTLVILPVSGVSHTVKKGETLLSLAKKYAADIENIKEFNKINDESSLVVGEVLIIPGGVQPQVFYAKNTQNTVPNVSLKNLFVSPGDATISTSVKGSATGYGKMYWPTSWRVITQYYTWSHHGLDIDGDYNSPIYAAEAGVIEWAGWKTGYGNCYIVNHGNGVKTLYAHLSKYFAKQGQQVARGETLGMMGSTGWSTGTHLHFEVRINGALVNPLNYIQ